MLEYASVRHGRHQARRSFRVADTNFAAGNGAFKFQANNAKECIRPFLQKIPPKIRLPLRFCGDGTKNCQSKRIGEFLVRRCQQQAQAKRLLFYIPALIAIAARDDPESPLATTIRCAASMMIASRSAGTIWIGRPGPRRGLRHFGKTSSLPSLPSQHCCLHRTKNMQNRLASIQ